MTLSLKHIFPVLASIIFLTSCTTTQLVMVHSDHSALVTLTMDSASYYNSSVIKNYSASKERVQFTILNVDSLGNYLDPYFNKNYFKFQYSGDSLTFSDGFGQAFVYNDDKSCCHQRIELTFDKPIKAIRTQNKFITHLENRVIISKRRKLFLKENTDVTIYLGE